MRGHERDHPRCQRSHYGGSIEEEQCTRFAASDTQPCDSSIRPSFRIANAILYLEWVARTAVSGLRPPPCVSLTPQRVLGVANYRRKAEYRFSVWDVRRAWGITSLTEVYHITHIDNVDSIIDEGGLCCDNLRAERDLDYNGIAHEHIKNRRAKRPVPTCEGGTLADYVPFYFAPRSPMLYAINGGYVEGYHGSQRPILHLVASVEAITEAGSLFTFTDGHADIVYSEYFDDLDDLDKLDWDIMEERYWRDTAEDGDRKRRRQAEFLVHQFLPWNQIIEIGVINNVMAAEVTGIIEVADHKPNVVVRRDWYY